MAAQQLEEMVENELAAAKAREEAEKEEDVDVVALVNAAVDERLKKYGLLTEEEGEVATDHISPQQMEVLAEKLDAVIVNVTASKTSVEDKVDATIAEHLHEMVQKEMGAGRRRRRARRWRARSSSSTASRRSSTQSI